MNLSKRPRLRYDVFISYSHRDKEWVRRWLVPRLKEAGIRVCIHHECFRPGSPSIIEIGRSILESRKTLLVLTQEYLQSEWAEFENLLAQTDDPAARRQRLIPLLLRPCSLPPRIEMLTYIDFTSIDFTCPEEQRKRLDHERLNQLISALRYKKDSRSTRKVTSSAHFPFGVPTGALSPDSPLYIERSCDRKIQHQVMHEGSTIIIEGCRQMGKSSLIARALIYACSNRCTVINFDFKTLVEEDLVSLDILLHYLVVSICEHLHLQACPSAEEIWGGPLGPKDKMTYFLNDYILRQAHTPVVFIMDEVDRVFGRSYQEDFFGLLRAWHDKRAQYPLWRKFNLVLSISEDPRQAIKDPRQSPFNVGDKIQLKDFSFDEMWKLNHRYGLPLRRKDQLHSLMDLIAGHPFLAQQAFYTMASKTYTLEFLLDTTTIEIGPFHDHLDHYRRLLESKLIFKEGMKQIIGDGRCPDYSVFSWLRSIGLISGNTHTQARPRCRLYQEYLRRVLT